MELESLIISRAHRTLRRLTSYRTVSNPDELKLSYTENVPLRATEKIIGVYENVPSAPDQNIIVTTLGFHILIDGKWKLIRYDQISHITTTPTESKRNVEGLVVYLRSGETYDVPVLGGSDRFRDAWELLHFLSRVTKDVREYSR